MGIFECRLDDAIFSDVVRIVDTRRHRVNLKLKVSFKNSRGTTARIRGVKVKVPPDNRLLRSDEYDPTNPVKETLVAWENSVDINAEYTIETEELNGDQLSQLRRGEAIDALCSAETIIILVYTEADEDPSSRRFSVASSKGQLRKVLQEVG